MTARYPFAAGAIAAALAAMATSAVAQTHSTARPVPAASGAGSAAAAAAALQVNSGPPITGVCLFSEPTAVAQSTVGQAVKTRMEQLLAQVKAELQPQQDGIEADGRALDAARTTIDQATYQKRAADLNLRVTSFQKLAQQRNQELEYTERKAVARIDSEIAPLLRDVYQQHTCSLLLNREAVLVANPAMDLTPGVVTALNGKIQTIAFEREHLDQQTPAQ